MSDEACPARLEVGLWWQASDKHPKEKRACGNDCRASWLASRGLLCASCAAADAFEAAKVLPIFCAVRPTIVAIGDDPEEADLP